MLKEKGFAPILILVGVLILVAIGSGAYYLGTIKNKPQIQNQVVTSQASPSSTAQPIQITQTPIPDETANWKTYIGKVSFSISDLQKSGLSTPPTFSIKYPADWTSQTTSDKIGYLGFTEDGKQYKARLNDGGMGLPPNPNLVRADSALMVDKYTGTKHIFKDKNKIFLISAEIGDQFFRILFVFDVPPTNQEKYIRIFNLMLSTFKFTDQISVNNPTVDELQGFPVYPNAVYLGKQPIVPCTNGAEENGFSTCNAVVYSWKTPDDFDKVTSWYREGGSGWICGGAGSYDGPRSASGGGNTCTKNNRRFGTFFDATAQETKIDFALYP